jgi:XTP/dITP diphosphohydrolase
MFQKIVLATHNKGKVAEILDLLSPFGIEVVSAGDLGLVEPVETETTFVGNALIKARAAAQASGLVALADDSGLCVTALNGDPGVYTADWAGKNRDYVMAMTRVHEALGSTSNRSAYFVSTLALVDPQGAEYIFEGRCDGQLVWPPRGQGGHGYDPFFVPDGDSKTFGEMSLDQKQKYSHRARAFEKFIEILK